MTNPTEQSVYQREGFYSRKDYLIYLSEKYGANYDVVAGTAELLGPEEDFDGLVAVLEDSFL